MVSAGLFVYYIDPLYKETQVLEEEKNQYDEALNKSKELRSIRDALLSKYNTFSAEDLERLNKLLPDTVDNVKLIMEINGIASRYGMVLKEVALSVVSSEDSKEIFGPDEKNYGSINIGFSVASVYNNFIAFIEDLEKSLRVVDVVSISFQSSETDFYKYSVNLEIYWLK